MMRGNSSNSGHSSASPSRGRVRELEDDELFGQVLLRPPQRSKQKVQQSSPTIMAEERQKAKKRPRSSSSSGNAHQRRPGTSASGSPAQKKELCNISATKKTAVMNRLEPQKKVSLSEIANGDCFDDSRRGCPPSPRTYDEIVSMFAPVETMKIDGIPRLSSLALAAARTYASRGKLVDLSDLADSQVHEVLGHKDTDADTLEKIEKLNPSRINVLEASWARLVGAKFGIRELPPKVKWWRAFYEMKRREDQISLERARARLKQRYNAADADKKKRVMEKTKVLAVAEKRKSKPASSAMSRIARLRMEVKKDRRKW